MTALKEKLAERKRNRRNKRFKLIIKIILVLLLIAFLYVNRDYDYKGLFKTICNKSSDVIYSIKSKITDEEETIKIQDDINTKLSNVIKKDMDTLEFINNKYFESFKEIISEKEVSYNYNIEPINNEIPLGDEDTVDENKVEYISSETDTYNTVSEFTFNKIIKDNYFFYNMYLNYSLDSDYINEFSIEDIDLQRYLDVFIDEFKLDFNVIKSNLNDVLPTISSNRRVILDEIINNHHIKIQINNKHLTIELLTPNYEII